MFFEFILIVHHMSDTIKAQLRHSALRALLYSTSEDIFNSHQIELFRILLKEPGSFSIAMKFIQKHHPITITTQVVHLIDSFIDGDKEFDENESKQNLMALMNSVDIHLPSSSKQIDKNTLNFVLTLARFSRQFVNYYDTIMKDFKNIENQNQIAFIIFMLMNSKNIDEYLEELNEYAVSKNSIPLIYWSLIGLSSKFNCIENIPKLKNIISY